MEPRDVRGLHAGLFEVLGLGGGLEMGIERILEEDVRAVEDDESKNDVLRELLLSVMAD